jgi:hypothetical protein
MTRCCSFLVSLVVMAIAMASRTTQAMTTVSETEAPPQTKPPADMIEEDSPIVLLEKSDFDGDFDVTAAPSPAPSSLSFSSSSSQSTTIEPPAATLWLPQKTHSPTYISYIPEYFLEAADAMTAPPSSAPTVKPAKDTTATTTATTAAKPTEKPTEKPTFPPPQTESPTTTTPPLIKLVGAQAPTAAPTASPSLMLLLEEEEDCNNDVVAQTSGSTVCPNNNNNDNNEHGSSSSIVHAIGDAPPTAAWSTGEGLLYDFQLLDNSVSFRVHNPLTTASINVYVELETTTTTSGGFVMAHCQSAKNLSHCASENENDANKNNLFVAACRPNHHQEDFALVKIFLESTATELLEIVAREGSVVVPKCCHSDDDATMADDGIHRNVVELVYKIDCSCSAAAILERRHRRRRQLRGNATAPAATVANTAI